MSKENPESIKDVIELMRDLKQKLEVAMADLIVQYEEATGLSIYSVEIIRIMNATMNVPQGKGTCVGGVKLETHLD